VPADHHDGFLFPDFNPGPYIPTPNSTDWKGSSQPIGRMRDGRPRKPGDMDLPAWALMVASWQPDGWLDDDPDDNAGVEPDPDAA
jgi:hypothetical protein